MLHPLKAVLLGEVHQLVLLVQLVQLATLLKACHPGDWTQQEGLVIPYYFLILSSSWFRNSTGPEWLDVDSEAKASPQPLNVTGGETKLISPLHCNWFTPAPCG